MTRTLSLICWNVWFDRLKFVERCTEILRICGEVNPDVICFQVVTPSFLRILQEGTLLTSYVSSEACIGPTIGSYGVLTLCKRELSPQFTSHPFRDTEMGRSLLLCDINIHGTCISVGTTHLESLNSAPVRRSQLLQCKDIFAGLPNPIILCGDFNFCSYRNFNVTTLPLENDVLRDEFSSFVDVWPQLRGDEKGFTFDSERNNNIRQHEVMRYDRVICDGKGILAPLSIDMLGTSPIGCATAPSDAFATPPPKQQPVLPSDHFGLHTTFSILNR